jgi:hypothetical protein
MFELCVDGQVQSDWCDARTDSARPARCRFKTSLLRGLWRQTALAKTLRCTFPTTTIGSAKEKTASLNIKLCSWTAKFKTALDLG